MKVLFIFSMVAISFSSYAQDEEEGSHKFRRDNIFLGGSIGLGLGNGGFSAGANPEIGYSFAKWLDAGISTNFNYFAYRAEYNGGVRQRSFNYGGGIFARFFPFRGFFFQVLPEYNRINTNFKSLNAGSIGSEYRMKREAPSLLLGVGYGSRMIGNTNFFTVLMIDAGTNTNSPYIDTHGAKLPILRTGFNFYLRPKRR
ncbi:MAG: hypothetical protein AVDCRST_MAG96-4278 [uncultured Segetibacter sp.]|uniref:Outer membrane protein beta-barrel domain-containing protein n=1 Tax=uncultured Segetibacter sp. TaxID=481133 RepID=A0A6J4U7Q4_9BACT|nr:MAG: hypothetical protein AVDCRST_MAG96-4278 [uncultured Segetibacter sp.]